MEDPVAKLANMIDARARRMQREAIEMRRLAARLRDTVTTSDTPTSEDTPREHQPASH